MSTVLVGLLLVQASCSHGRASLPSRPAPLSEPMRAELRTVGLVASDEIPDASVVVRPVDSGMGSGEAAGGGAAAGAMVGTFAGSSLLPYGILFPPLLLVAGGMFVVSALTGAIIGGLAATDDEGSEASIRQIENALRALSTDPKLQISMRDEVVRAGHGVPFHRIVLLKGYGPETTDQRMNHEVLTVSGIDGLLEVQVERVTLAVEETTNPRITLVVSVNSRLLRTQDGTELDRRTFKCLGGNRTFAEWRADEVRPFTQGLSRCYQQISHRLVEELFLVYVPPQQVRWIVGGAEYARVEQASLRPTLAWDHFEVPETGNDVVGNGSHHAASGSGEVTYDLKVWRADQGFPGDLVYARTGLSEPSHELEDALAAGTSYVWTVRARYRLDGDIRVTPWAVSQERVQYSPGKFDRVSNSFYYRFKTPQDTSQALAEH